MKSPQRLELAHAALACVKADAAEVLVTYEAQGLTRFTHNAIHQNISKSDVEVRVRAIVGTKTGVAVTNQLDGAALAAAAARAVALATFAPEDPAFIALGGRHEYAPNPGAFSQRTASATPGQRAEIADGIFAVAEREDVWSAGFVSTRQNGTTLVNSSGACATFDDTAAACNVKLNAAESTGYAECFSIDVADLHGRELAAVAAEKARVSAHPQSVEAGPWTVILEPAAFGELISYVTDHFSAQAYDEGSSFLSGALGASFVGENVTMFDDFTHPLNPGMPFDFEGAPKMRVPLFDAGVARSVVTDATWASKLQRENTGHALPAPNSAGPQPQSVTVMPGTKSVQQLIAETKRGLLVTRFWYIRPVDNRLTIVTGMTRDGTFLIENGKLVRGVRNMRFNQSILEALKHCELSDTPVRTGSYGYSLVAPAAKIEGFTFSSGTAF